MIDKPNNSQQKNSGNQNTETANKHITTAKLKNNQLFIMKKK